jgi:hypothetical protein
LLSVTQPLLLLLLLLLPGAPAPPGADAVVKVK